MMCGRIFGWITVHSTCDFASHHRAATRLQKLKEAVCLSSCTCSSKRHFISAAARRQQLKQRVPAH